MTAPLNTVRRSLFLISMPMVFISFALPLRAEDLGASGFQIGLLFSIFTASLFVLRPLVGIGVDRFGRRPFFLLALFLYAVTNGVYAFSTTLESLFFARLLHGFGFAFLSITTDTITADLTESDGRAAAMGGNIASQTRGGMVGATIGFGLVGAIPLHAWLFSFATFAATSVLALLFAFQAIPETGSKSAREGRHPRFRLTPELMRLLVVVLLIAFSGALIQPYIFIYLRDRFGLELWALAVAFVPLGIAQALLPVWLGRATGAIARSTAMVIGLLAGACLYAVVPLMPTIYLTVAIMTGAAAGGVLAELTKTAWIADISHAEMMGRTYGTAALVAGTGATLGPLIGGLIYDGIGKDYIFYGNATILLIAAAFILLFLRPAHAKAGAN